MPDNLLAPTIPKLTSDWNTQRNDSHGWPKFLQSVKLRGIRGWTGQTVEFRYPVVAIAGENGAGKSTILKAIASSYQADPRSSAAGVRTFSPDDFFPNTPWEVISGVYLDFVYREGTNFKSHTIRKPTHRWRGMPERPLRAVYFLDISRTQPIDTLIGYGRLARLAIAGEQSTRLSSANLQILSRVMSRSYDTGEIIRGDLGKQVGVLGLQGRVQSNFHQGAGEDATTDLIALLQGMPRNSLVLVDEVEASLHPRAQRRLMTELIDLARSERLQLIVTTHSPYVLDQLPPEARIYIADDRQGGKEVIYGATSDYAIGRMDDVLHPELDIYCEDAQAAYVVDALIRSGRPEAVRRVRIVSVGPASTVRVMGDLAARNQLPRPSVGILDSDQPESAGCVRLPGAMAPEREVLGSLTEATWAIVGQRLGVRTGDLLDAAEDAMRDDQFHVWGRRIAESVSPSMRVDKVWEACVDVWVADVLTAPEKAGFTDAVLRDLPELIAGADRIELDVPED